MNCTSGSTKSYISTYRHLSFQLDSANGRQYRLCPARLITARDKGMLDIPDISEKEINDKSKADVVVKSITCIQILYFVT